MCHFRLWHLLSGTLEWKNETKSNSIKLNNWSFFFNLCYTFVRLNVVLPCTVWLQNKGKILSEYYNQLDISLLEPAQNNLSNPEAYLEPCQTSKMDCFAKIVNSWKSLKVVNYFCKALHLRFLTEFWIRLCNLQFIVWENRGC